MKKTLLLMVIIIFLVACSAKELIEPNADFEYKILDSGSPYSQDGYLVTFLNNSENAATFDWYIVEPFVNNPFITEISPYFSYEYTIPGSHEVQLTVESQDGLQANITKNIFIPGQTVYCLIDGDFGQENVLIDMYKNYSDFINGTNALFKGNFYADEKFFITHIEGNTQYYIDLFMSYNDKVYRNEEILFTSSANDVSHFCVSLSEYKK